MVSFIFTGVDLIEDKGSAENYLRWREYLGLAGYSQGQSWLLDRNLEMVL